MRKYEEKLHFDKYYNKLQENNVLQRYSGVVWGIAGYVLLYYFARYILAYIPDFRPWGDIETWFAVGGVRFIKADLVYFTFGLILNCYGTVRLSKITVQNHSARSETGHMPQKLLVNGFYAKVRHPMYGTFIILQAGFMLSLRSFAGMIIALIVIIIQYSNAIIEEKKQLKPIFGEEYNVYIKNVSCILLTRSQIAALVLAALFSAAGFVF
ncbi:MAG: methyltransferase [Bacillota bacterium]|nr:methyltransferase [Bacillota bacterium]